MRAKQSRRSFSGALPIIAAGVLVLGAGSLGGGPIERAEAQSEGRADARAEEHAAGKAVFDYWCAPCHSAGPGNPGTQGLQIKYGGTEIPAALEQRTDLTPTVVKTFVRQGVLAMAPFRKTEITDSELDELAAYLSAERD